MLKKLKRYTTLPVRKQLTESLIFSRLDCCNNLFIDLPQYQTKCLLKLQKACAGFVLNKYATCEDITKLKWLLVPERINFTIAKLIVKGLLQENIPENLEIRVTTSNRSLRTPNKAILEYANLQKQQSVYINYANTVYNELNKKIKKCKQYSAVVNRLRKYFIEKTIATALGMT